jgi:DNA polymerase elongation subunit (family B)
MKHLGWILDLYPKAGRMVVWLKKTDGTCIRLSDEWRPRIHVAGDIDNLKEIAWKLPAYACKFVERFERAGAQSKSTVLELEVGSEKEALSLARRIQRYGDYSKFRLYDVDIPPAQTYLYEKNLFPLASVEAEETGDGIEWSLRDSRESLNYALPALRKITLQVKTKSAGRIQKFEDKLDSVIIRDDSETVTLESGDETEKLRRLAELFPEIDPDIVLTEGGDSFLFPYLAKRAELNGLLDEMILGRDYSPLQVSEYQGHSYFSYGKILFRQTAARLLGRLHIDRWNSFFVEDCGLEGLFEVARTCVIPVQRTSRTTIGTSMTSLQLYEAMKHDVLIPWNKNEPEEFKTGNELVMADKGGLIFEPQVGIHDDVGEFDFSSLYPTIMLKHNLSGETVKCKCCPDSADRVPELGYNICEKWTGIVPRSLDILLRKRATYQRYKKEAADPPTKLRYDQRQAALKWILVCS